MPLSTSSQSYWGLVPPGITLAVSIIVAVFLFYRYRGKIDKWLVRARSKRLFFFTGFVIFIPLLVAGITNWANISEVAKGKIGLDDQILLSIDMFLVVAYLWGHSIWFWHNDKWDARLKQEKKHTKDAKDSLDREEMLHNKTRQSLDFVLGTSKTFLNVIASKAKRIQDSYKKLSKKKLYENRTDEERKICEKLKEENKCKPMSNLKNLHATMNPESQIGQLIMNTHLIFKERLQANSSLRIAYFCLDKDYMEPAYSWDGYNENCITTPLNKYREKFKIDCAAENLVVYVAHSGRIESVPSAEEAHAESRHPFYYYGEEQKEKIKSLVAIPLKVLDTLPDFKPVLVVDTNEPGFFGKYTEKEFEHIQENLSNRLLTELDTKLLFEELLGRT